MGKIRGIIFDLDGTLIDTLEAYTRAFNQGIKSVGLAPISRERLAAFLNRALELEKILIELADIFQDEAIRRRGYDEIIRAYLGLQEETVFLRPGAKEVLQQLKEMGLKIGIVTGRTTSGPVKWRELRRLGIDRFIDSLITGADAARKPAPDGVIKCLQELELRPEECAMVGDSQADIVTGKAAGVMTIAIPGGVASEDALSSEQPDVKIGSLAELPALILGDSIRKRDKV